MSISGPLVALVAARVWLEAEMAEEPVNRPSPSTAANDMISDADPATADRG